LQCTTPWAVSVRLLQQCPQVESVWARQSRSQYCRWVRLQRKVEFGGQWSRK